MSLQVISTIQFVHEADVFSVQCESSYGGIFERGSREYTLDDFYALALDKMDRYLCLKESAVLVPPPGEESSSSDDEDSDGTDTGHYESENETVLDDGTVVESTETGKLGEMVKIGKDDLEDPTQAPKVRTTHQFTLTSMSTLDVRRKRS